MFTRYRLIDGLLDENRGPKVRRLGAQFLFFMNARKLKLSSLPMYYH